MEELALYILIGALLFGALLFVLLNFKSNKVRKKNSSFNLERNYQIILNALNSSNLSVIKNAVLTADKLIDHILKSKGYKGETLGERARQAKEELGDLYDVFWDAHRTRNRMVHEIDSEVRYNEAKEALSKFKLVIEKLRK